ncbi:MAG: L,D-transpeptidase family protein [Chitinophagales bacterium]
MSRRAASLILLVALVTALAAGGRLRAAGPVRPGTYPCGCEEGTGRTPAVPTEGGPRRAPGHVHVRVDLPRRTLTVYFDYVPVKVYPVAIGKPETPTPVGEWRIIEKAQWGEGLGRRWMQISVPWGTYGIHGTSNPGSIGQAASSGCIRMFTEDADELYQWVQLGTPVLVTDEYADPLEGRRRLGDGETSSRVLLVQRALRRAGYYQGPLDGLWGPSSVAATRAFQRAKGFPVTGLFEGPLFEALGLIPFE